MTTSTHAAIDIGTNSIHLLVADVGADGDFTVLTTEKETVRLGEGPGDIRELAPAAIDRGIAALCRFRAIADSFDAAIEAVATSAVREAENGSEFVKRASVEAGIDVDVISGPEEARLIHLGVLQALPMFDRQLLIVDIGGGSTEILVGKAGLSIDVRSIKLGHLRLTNRFFPNGEVTADAVDACRQFVASYLVPTATALAPLGFQTAVGSSGTATAIGEILQTARTGRSSNAGLDLTIDAEALAALVDELSRWPTATERCEMVAGLTSRRADVIVAGAILLHEIFKAFSIERMVTSPFALREGVLLDRTHGIEGGAARLQDLRRDSLLRMADAFEEDRSHVQHSTDLALRLFDELAATHELAAGDRELLEAAGLLHNVGVFVSHAAHHQHSEYIIRHSDRLVGYTEREIEIIAQVARYHRRSAPKSSHQRFVALAKADQFKVRWLAGMLRIAIALDRTRQSAVTSVRVAIEADQIRVTPVVLDGNEVAVEIFTANERSELLARIADRSVTVEAD